MRLIVAGCSAISLTVAALAKQSNGCFSSFLQETKSATKVKKVSSVIICRINEFNVLTVTFIKWLHDDKNLVSIVNFKVQNKNLAAFFKNYQLSINKLSIKPLPLQPRRQIVCGINQFFN